MSKAFLKAVQSNSRKFYWTGRITTKAGKVYPFGYEDIVKGSGYISSQCCGSTELELRYVQGCLSIWRNFYGSGRASVAAEAHGLCYIGTPRHFAQ